MADVKVAVCIATHHRPEGLVRLLRSLEATQVPADVALAIVVADNDPDASEVARRDDLARLTRWPLQVVHEPAPGISPPRNAAVRAARDRGADLFAFVDDDEVVDDDWLERHLAGRRLHEADVTTGPVDPYYDPEVPDWWRQTGLHGPESKASGTVLPVCWTNNTVVARHVLDDVTPWFADEFRWGGEDAEYFTRVGRRGHRIVWVEEARVAEQVPAARTTLSWVARRYLVAGRVKGILERRHHGRASVRAVRRVLVGGFYVLRGVALLTRSGLRSGPMLARAVRDLSFGVGQATGVLTGGPAWGTGRRTPVTRAGSGTARRR